MQGAPQPRYRLPNYVPLVEQPSVWTADTVGPDDVRQQDRVGESVLRVKHGADGLAQPVHRSEPFDGRPLINDY